MNRILAEIHKLQLERLKSDWVDLVFSYEFTGFDDIPKTYEAVLNSIRIERIFENILGYIDELDLEENNWASLSQHILYKNLLAVIGHYIKQGIENVDVPNHRYNALLAARVYFRLLLIPGARAYDFYHSQLFAQSISCLGFPKLMCEKNEQYKNNKHLSSEVNLVLKELTVYVVDLKVIILQLKLTTSDINFEDILSNLVDVIGGAITQTLNNVDKILMSNVSSVIYQVISCMMCNYGEHPNPKAIELLFKCLLPKLIASSADSKVPTSYVRASYVTYAGVILTSHCKASVKSFIIMLEHLCYNVDHMERAESRNARADLVVGLMSLLPNRRHRKFLKWVLILSKTDKAVHRQIALEILARLLNNEPEINEQRETIRNEIEKQSAVTNILPSGISEGQSTIEDDNSQDSQASSKENVDTLNTIEPEDDDDDEVAGWQRLQQHRVPLGQILLAVYECGIDVCSPVRQRSLAVLAESVSSRRPHMVLALQELNGKGTVSRLMALGARSVCDERAVVRRGAVALILRLLTTSTSLPTRNDLAILVRLCRDAAITVRTAAISALSDLITMRRDESLVEAFLTGPMRQLSDPETKVQEQVKSLIEQILLKPLMKYTENAINENILPWLFLEGVIKKNMRRNLQNALASLANTENCISVRLVDILSTHLGVKDESRDLQCLVLLTCVAPHVDYSDIGFVLEYYFNLTKNPDPEILEEVPVVDSRLLILVVELISAWSRFLKTDDRITLREHIVRRLAAAQDDGCRLQSAALAKELDSSNLVWASELMLLSERRAIESNCLDEALRAADLSLIAPTSPSPALLQLFLTALKTPPPDWSDVRAGECVAGVGRLCIRRRAEACDAAPTLAELLHSDAPMQARVNALLALADISQRYTNIVEPLMNIICGCLKPEAPAKLRRAAVRSLTELLLSGFLRLRTPLYFNYCALLADNDVEVREPAEYYVTSCLRVDIISQYFVDCILHYNREHYPNLDFDSRQLIYDVMLQRLSLVQKLNTQCRLARDILEHAAELADNAEEIPEALHNAMLDTIKVFIGPRMRLPRKPQQTGELADIDDLQERVTTNIVSHRTSNVEKKMKRTVAEILVPSVMRLYARLGPAGGQLTAYIVMLVQDLEVDYKHEIEELIENDEELVTRLAAFRENHRVDSTTGNMRNLVTTSGPPEPETPRPHRKRMSAREPLKKRNLKI